MISRFYADAETTHTENNIVLKCNLITHKIQVINYMSGDDRDHWSLKCNECQTVFGCSLPWDAPYLNFCPYCSDMRTHRKLATYLEDYSIWDSNTQQFKTIFLIDDALLTPEYKK